MLTRHFDFFSRWQSHRNA